MNAETNYPLTLLFDAACPVCSLEMDNLRERNSAGRLAFVDITAPGFDAEAYGSTLNELNARIHAVRPDGSHLVGLEALREAYAAVGLAWVLRATALAALRPLADAAYALFARHRRPISRATAPLIHAMRTWRAWRTQARMARCQAGVCDVPADGKRDGGQG
jgi:predicted DCC family thiol-disulfide oxidoreductase YuxK